VARDRGEGGGCDAVSECRGGNHDVGGRISAGGSGVPFLKGSGGRRNGGGSVWVQRRGRHVEEAGLKQGVPADWRAVPGDSAPKPVGASDVRRARHSGRTEGEGRG
jgi:hypothetical protein